MIITEDNELLEIAARVTPQWLAGFFDGEGCVSVYTLANANVPSFKVNLTQANLRVLTVIASHFKHCSGPSLKRHKRHKSDVYELTWTSRGCLEILEYIKDFVVIKRKQVELGIEMAKLFQDIHNAPRYLSRENVERRRAIEQEMRRLNGSRERVTRVQREQVPYKSTADKLFESFKGKLSKETIEQLLLSTRKGGLEQ